MAQAHLPSGNLVHVGSLQVDSPDDNLRVIIHNCLDSFAKSPDMLVITNRGESVSQAREADAGESHSRADR